MFASYLIHLVLTKSSYRCLAKNNDCNDARKHENLKILNNVSAILSLICTTKMCLKKQLCPKRMNSKLKKIKGYKDIVKRILEFNSKIQSGQGLKILTPSHMLSRLPISLV